MFLVQRRQDLTFDLSRASLHFAQTWLEVRICAIWPGWRAEILRSLTIQNCHDKWEDLYSHNLCTQFLSFLTWQKWLLLTTKLPLTLKIANITLKIHVVKNILRNLSKKNQDVGCLWQKWPQACMVKNILRNLSWNSRDVGHLLQKRPQACAHFCNYFVIFSKIFLFF